MLIIFIVVTNKSPKVYNNKKETAKWQILLLGQEREGKENKKFLKVTTYIVKGNNYATTTKTKFND